MFTLKYQENSDARCGGDIRNFASWKDADREMETAFLATLRVLLPDMTEEFEKGLEKEEFRQLGGDAGVGKDGRLAYLSKGKSAEIQIGIDDFQWEIIEDPDFVPARSLYTVTGIIHNEENGGVFQDGPYLFTEFEAAEKKLRELYQTYLETYDVEDNGACDENEESCPGGYLDFYKKEQFGEACVYAMPQYALNCLVKVAVVTLRKAELETE